ncbi:MAG TPA: 16S rRNA (adenine(1518)-N(6)/adenine(1519)-N(6))-dimethyltransferase RsmA [Nitrospiraceae bacterium]|nr:16S rRNA (adenine(1518)-N(6)/adenine(1519)-N(6))-dimethyltransferase RsmA [Nitrospiraceae bacterium]
MGSSHPPALKRFGQNFLIDHNIARKMIGLAAIQPHETVLEIGPGRGILTRGLCAEARTVIAIEIDRQLARLLGRPRAEHASSSGRVMESDVPPLAAQCSNLDLRIGDALEFSYEALPCGTVVVANLPYYVSTPLLFKLLESYSRIDRMVLMLQTEVALRLVAKPHTKEYGILSVLTQYGADVTLSFRVSSECFRPRPTVGSAVLHLRIKRERSLDRQREPHFVKLVRASFAHRRKTLLNSLRDEGYEGEHVSAALARCGIAPNHRAENLSVEDYLALAAALSDASDVDL